jgi:hypothetical protein
MHVGRIEHDPECINTPPHLILSLSDRESADGDVVLLNKDPSGAGASPEYSDTLVTDTSVPTETGTKPIELLPKSWQKLSTASCWYTYTLTRICRCHNRESYAHTSLPLISKQHCYTPCSVMLTTILKRARSEMNLRRGRMFCGPRIT